MANNKSSRKRIKVIAKKELINKMISSRTKTAIKKVVSAASTGNKEEAQQLLVKAVSSIDKAAGKGIYHKNNAARKKSHLAKLINKMA